jgi:ADP-ribosylglycohydrolase
MEMTTQERIRAALTAYAAGDATGVPWEGWSAREIDPALIGDVPRRGDWPPGATSDDTALTLLVAGYLAEHGAVVDEGAFLSRLAAAVPEIRGIGPSTQAAVDRFRADGAIHADTGATNGAAMRALPIGWAIGQDAPRRAVTVGLSRTTHGAPEAILAACVAAAMASAAVDGESLLDAAAAELSWAHSEHGPVLSAAVDALEGRWQPDPRGVPLDAVQTVAAVITVVRRAAEDGLTLADAIRHAISWGGDTDTVAAIAAGILGCDADTTDLPWSARLALPPDSVLDDVSGALSALRASLR